MRILALDASAGLYVARAEDSKIVASAADEQQRRHVESIEALTSQVLGHNPVDAVAVGTGPGGFSGMRVGIAWAIGYALGKDIPVVGVGTHDAIALGAGGHVTVATDARRHEQFVTVFGGLDDAGLPVIERATETRTTIPSDGNVLVDPKPDLAALAQFVDRLVAAGRELPWPRPLYVRQPDAKLPSARS